MQVWPLSRGTVQILAYPLGKLQLQAVGIPDIEKHVKTLIDEDKICATSIQKVVDVINAAYEWAIRRREWDYNPVSAVKTELIRRLRGWMQKMPQMQM